MKIIFEPLSKESLWIRLWRAFTYSCRKNEHIRVGMNGHEFVIKRGIVVDVPEWVPEVSSHAPKEMMYNCYVPYKPKEVE